MENKKTKAPLEFIVILTDSELSMIRKESCFNIISNSDVIFIIVGTNASGIGYDLGIPRDKCFTSEFLINGDFENALGNASSHMIVNRVAI